MPTLNIGTPNAKQKLFLKDTHKYVAFGGARGGGKSWAVRAKAKLLALAYPGIKILIIRRTYPELINNHINILISELNGIAKYKQSDKVFNFSNGSIIKCGYLSGDHDLGQYQGSEWDVIFFDEATQLSEYQIKQVIACLRGTNSFIKRVFFTCNPGGQGHAYIKRLFVDRKFENGEHPEEYSFIQSLVTDNDALMANDPDYIRQLEMLPEKLRKAWLEGSWDIFEGQFFEDFRDDKEGYRTRRYTHVIEPFDIPDDWNVYMSYDFGYSKPFSFNWFAVDSDGRAYLIVELYGCTKDADTGVKWTAEEQFKKVREIESQHPLLVGRKIKARIADPAIWNASTGESIEEKASKAGLYFNKGDNQRISGWMQFHYRLAFDKNGIPMFYVFNTCKSFIRTIPTLTYSETVPEDVDTKQEDHIADACRYFFQSRPISARDITPYRPIGDDPLNMIEERKRSDKYTYINI